MQHCQSRPAADPHPQEDRCSHSSPHHHCSTREHIPVDIGDFAISKPPQEGDRGTWIKGPRGDPSRGHHQQQGQSAATQATRNQVPFNSSSPTDTLERTRPQKMSQGDPRSVPRIFSDGERLANGKLPHPPYTFHLSRPAHPSTRFRHAPRSSNGHFPNNEVSGYSPGPAGRRGSDCPARV